MALSSTTITKITIAEALEILGWSIPRLAREAGLSDGAVRHAVTPGCNIKTGDTSAAAIAKALGFEVHEIDWVNGITDRGRPAKTGAPVTRSTRTPTYDDVCPVHFIVLPASKVCDLCG